MDITLVFIIITGIVRVLSNGLRGILPDQSADVPNTVNIYNIQKELAIKQNFAESISITNATDDTSDMTIMEKAYIATQIALKNQLAASDNTLDVWHIINYKSTLILNVVNRFE